MRSLTLAAALLAITGLAPLAAAQITVGPAGSGAQFTEIQDAIDVAPPNSIILVHPANYSKPLFIDKSLTIIGDTIHASRPRTIRVEVTGIDALEEVRLTGIRIQGSTSTFPLLYVHDCAGRVVVNDVVQFATGKNPVTVVRDADALIADRWEFETIDWLIWEEIAAPSTAHALTAERSSIWISNSRIRAMAARPLSYNAVAASGIHSVDSFLSISNCEVRGGRGFSACDWSVGCEQFLDAKAGPGIHAIDSRIRVSGGPDNIVSAGMDDHFSLVHGVVLQSGSILQHAADAVFQNSEAISTLPSISASGGSVVDSSLQRWPNIELSAQRVSPGQVATMNTRGNRFSLHLLFYATQMQLPFDEPLLQGPILLDIGAVVQLAEFATDVNGNGSFGFAVPPIPQLIGFGVHFQTLELGAAGAFISNAALLTITNVN